MKKLATLGMVMGVAAVLAACGGETSSVSENSSAAVAETVSMSETEETEVSPFAEVEEDYTLKLPVYMMVEESVEGLSSHHAENFQFDEKGKLVSFSCGERKTSDNFTVEYDERGRETKITKDGLYGYTIEYEYNDMDQKIGWSRVGYNDAAGSYVYDENGMLGQSISQEGNYCYRYEYGYDENGRVTKKTVYEAEDGGEECVDSEWEYQYDDAGRIEASRVTFYDEGVKDDTSQYTILYDAYGHWINQNYGSGNISARYDVAGYEEISADNVDYLFSVSEWKSFDEYEGLPLPSSVIAPLCRDVSDAPDGHVFEIADDGYNYEFFELIGTVNGIWNSNGEDPVAVSVHPGINKALWSYEAVLTQLLGFEMNDIGEGKFGISKDGAPVAVLSIEWRDGTCYWKIDF